MDTFRLYAHSAKMLVKCQLQYRTSFILQIIAQLVMMGGEMLAVVLIIDRFGTLGRWGGGDLMFFFGVMTTQFYIVECLARGVTNFSPLVRTGALDTMLLRPRGVLTQVICYAIDLRRIGAIGVGVVAMIIGAKRAQIVWTPLKALALCESTLMSGLLITGLFMIEAVLCIRSVKSIEMVNILTYGGRGACQYPIDAYPRPLRILFMVVAPFALTMHMPVAYVLNKPLFPVADWVTFVSPVAGAAFFFLMYLLFRRAMRRYRSTGS